MSDPILSANTRTYVGDTAFANDRLDRRALAEKLTGYLSRLNDGAVLAIDAPWGEGKTWFGRNWAKHLEDNSYKVVYIDAFEQDYVEDPFMLITSEILSIVDDDGETEKKLKKSGIEVAKALLPFLGKAVVNFAGRVALGSSDLTGEAQEAIDAVTESVADSASAYIKESLESYGKDKVIMAEFKAQLAEFAQAQEQPIVIFIDELDRCKPNFAVNLIERIKHFFDVPNIVFVLLLNRDQLEKAVKGVYGSETDASAYLGKFVNFFFALPKPIHDGFNYQSRQTSFINATMKKYKFKNDNNIHEGFISHMRYWSRAFQMSLRDIEKAVALYSFTGLENGESSWIIVYLIALKIKHPQLYAKLVSGEIEAHKQAKGILEQLKEKDSDYMLEFFIEWHKAYETGFSNLSEGFMSQLPFRYRHQANSNELFKNLSAYIDLGIN